MSPRRRNVAAGVAVVLLLVLGIVGLGHTVDYTIFYPGPTVNVLGDNGHKPIIEVTGHRSYRDDGGLRLVTIVFSGLHEKVSLAQALSAWIDPDEAVYPHEAVYHPTDTQSSVRQQSAAEMAGSQDNAVAAALAALHIQYSTVVRIRVGSVDPKGPASDKLKVGDVILGVDGQMTATTAELVRSIKSRPPGTPVRLRISRSGKTQSVTMTTGELGTSGAAAHESRIGIGLTTVQRYRFPFDVSVHLSDNIGGPSAGLMFSLGIYDVLTPGSLTDGRVVAGTGEIDAQGQVGEIGGIQQKIVGAEHDGARLFLVPAGNCDEALGAHYDPGKMQLVKVSTMEDALHAIQAWVADPGADLPRCTS